MTSLVALKLEGNPIRFPPKEILQPQSLTSPGSLQEYENDDVAITAQVKRFLKQKILSERFDVESGGEESSEGTETPRPMRRATGAGGRFPIKVPGSDIPETIRSPGTARAPPIPSRSHYREVSLQSSTGRKPGTAPLPLTIGNPNERVRSNSEGVSQSVRGSTDKSKRLGIVQSKATELGSLDEARANRYSHFRGLSHGSAMQGSSSGVDSMRGPASPADNATPRATYVRRLSSLPERRRESLYLDPVIEAAKGVLYAVFQIHPIIQGLLKLTRDGTNKRTSLERVYYNANTHVEQLDNDLQAHENYTEEDEDTTPRSNENVYHACMTCVNSYMHICALLDRNVQLLVSNSDPRYVRTLLLLVYGSIAEIKNASMTLAPNQYAALAAPQLSAPPVASSSRDKSLTPTRKRPGTISSRHRGTTVVQSLNGLRVAVDSPTPPLASSRTATMTSVTPRSGESFTLSVTTSNSGSVAEFSEEDRIFEQIYLRLQQSTDMASKTLPVAYDHLVALMNISNQHNHSEQLRQAWQALMQKTMTSMATSETLKRRLSLIKLKEPGIRSQRNFWELCNVFIEVISHSCSSCLV